MTVGQCHAATRSALRRRLIPVRYTCSAMPPNFILGDLAWTAINAAPNIIF